MVRVTDERVVEPYSDFLSNRAEFDSIEQHIQQDLLKLQVVTDKVSLLKIKICILDLNVKLLTS